MGISALTLTLGGRIAPLGLAGSTVLLTVAFGLGQIIGPVFAGLVASRTHGFSLADAAASVIVLLGAVSWLPCCRSTCSVGEGKGRVKERRINVVPILRRTTHTAT